MFFFHYRMKAVLITTWWWYILTNEVLTTKNGVFCLTIAAKHLQVHLHGQQIPQGAVLPLTGKCDVQCKTNCILFKQCLFTAPVFQETTLCVSHYIAHRQAAARNLSALLQNTMSSAQKANQHTHHHRSPLFSSRAWLRECQCLVTSFSYLEKRHFPGLPNEQMQLIKLLANKWWDGVTASNDALGFSKKRGAKFSVQYVFMAGMLGICIQRMCKWIEPLSWLWQSKASQINLSDEILHQVCADEEQPSAQLSSHLTFLWSVCPHHHFIQYSPMKAEPRSGPTFKNVFLLFSSMDVRW